MNYILKNKQTYRIIRTIGLILIILYHMNKSWIMLRIIKELRIVMRMRGRRCVYGRIQTYRPRLFEIQTRLYLCPLFLWSVKSNVVCWNLYNTKF